MDQLGIGYLSVFGLPPVEFVEVAAALECRFISLFLRGGPLLPLGYPPFSLQKDHALRDSLGAALRHHGVTITLADGFLVVPGGDVRGCAADLDVVAELGIPRLNVVSLDNDLGRTFDEFAVLTGLPQNGASARWWNPCRASPSPTCRRRWPRRGTSAGLISSC